MMTEYVAFLVGMASIHLVKQSMAVKIHLCCAEEAGCISPMKSMPHCIKGPSTVMGCKGRGRSFLLPSKIQHLWQTIIILWMSSKIAGQQQPALSILFAVAFQHMWPPHSPAWNSCLILSASDSGKDLSNRPFSFFQYKHSFIMQQLLDFSFKNLALVFDSSGGELKCVSTYRMSEYQGEF